MFGLSPKIRVMDLFLSDGDAGFTKSALANITGLSRTTIPGVVDDLVKIGFAKLKDGKYYINRYDRNINLIADFYQNINGFTGAQWEVSVDE
jgi:DNA-binding IclR family transcriptional regulator